MKLIVGLGNPGLAYRFSRHNLGFQVAKELAKIYKVDFRHIRAHKSLVARRKDLILVLPLTYMNLSGQAVKSLVKKFKIALSDLLVVCDDVALPLGKIRIRAKGSSGGHNGLKSIIEELEAENFARLRIGIGVKSAHGDNAQFVLSNFTKSELRQVKDAIQKGIDCCGVWLKEGVARAMQEFNG